MQSAAGQVVREGPATLSSFTPYDGSRIAQLSVATE